ncbi:kinase D-interacting substrate of 220 kDa B isoform X1 [Schistocerca gregaria]|nr:kinase D-interacting substrate of 220 kDa B isoform X1 [Schistocerca gregaria]
MEHNMAPSQNQAPSRHRYSFLRLHIPDGALTHNWSVPTLTITTPSAESTRKFSFGLHRYSQTTLHRTDSMVSLCYRSLSAYISDDNISGLQNFLENKRVQVDDRDENGTTALIFAATKGKLNFVRELINHGAEVNAEDGDNWTALLCAAKEGYADICEELLEHGADTEHRDMGGWTALMWAAYKGRDNVVDVLVAHNAEVNAHGNFHLSALLWAAGRGHSTIVQKLLRNGAKVNVGDKYGTTALIWASRKGNTEIVDALLKAGANVDTAGMYSWTPLLVATLGNHVEVVNRLLEHKPNVNALDKDGCTALTLACKEGFHEIAVALLNAGAYINIQDRAGDTNLIHAVKGGHRGVVEALLKKYADVDISGKDRKTALYWAVEKGNVAMVKLLLTANPDLETSTKDGDTALLRAVRIRNAEITQLLLDKKAKVSAADKKGDTALHIAMRARSKGIVEILLRNPKNSQLLYCPNKAGETPYNIDMNHQKTILGQIFGARRLNTNEDNENMLGYDLYSSALADILSEPSLSMPITVGLYAKWGSGKSFLLNKLREEMKNFARQWIDPVFQFSSLLLAVVVHILLMTGVVVGLVSGQWVAGVSTAAALLILIYTFLVVIWYGSQRYDWYWPYNFNVSLTRKLNTLKLILQVMFCHPPGSHWNDGITAQPIRFYFTDQTRVSSTTGGENSVVQMLGSLYDSIERDYGAFATRLYRAFRPKAVKSTSAWRWRKLCCLPYVVIFEFAFLTVLGEVSMLALYLVDVLDNGKKDTFEGTMVVALMIALGVLLASIVVANLYTWSQMLQALLFSQRRHLQRTIARLDTLKSEGFLQALRSEVNLMTEMVKCLDSFTSQQTRLVIIVDGLDSCEQDKVLLVLDAVHMLFSDSMSPFIVILAIDPHVIAKAVEVNSRRLFSESNIGGHDYLRNMVHLPFYLQNSGLRKVKVAQATAVHHHKSNATWTENEENVALAATTSAVSSVSGRRLSSESGFSSTDKLKRKGSRKLKLSESVASSLGSNLNRVGGAHDLTKMLLTDDYFSDVNPRSMRRLLNVVYITGRLLKAFQIDFNWYHLASWVNITEQWPFRTSWIILYYDTYEESLDDNTSLKSLYDKVRPQIPISKDVEPLLELDRDEKKFDIFLTYHRNTLLVSDMKVFLPFTINLDPYIKKVIKEDQQNMDDTGLQFGSSFAAKSPPPQIPVAQQHSMWSSPQWATANKTSLLRRQRPIGRSASVQSNYAPAPVVSWPQGWMTLQEPMPHPPLLQQPSVCPPLTIGRSFPEEVLENKLSGLTVDGVCSLLAKIEDLSTPSVSKYANVIRDNNINGRVLLHCDLEELKKVLQMSFGDWELFRMLIVSLRETEFYGPNQQEELTSKNVRFSVPTRQFMPPSQERKGLSSKQAGSLEKEKSSSRSESRTASKQTVMEKQVTLEEQMICGALQTLNEEACEDVLDETEAPQEPALNSTVLGDVAVVPAFLQEASSHTNSSCGSTADLQGAGTSILEIQHQKSNYMQACQQRPSSLPVTSESRILPPSPSHYVAIRSHSAEDRVPQPSSTGGPSLLQGLASSLVTPASSLEKLNRLKDRLLRSVSGPPSTASVCGGSSVISPAPSIRNGSGGSDDESTPLVSESSTPGARTSRVGVTTFFNGGFGGADDSGGSSPSSPPSPEDREDSRSPSLSPSFVSPQFVGATRVMSDNTNLDALGNVSEHLPSSRGSSASLSRAAPDSGSNYCHLVTVSRGGASEADLRHCGKSSTTGATIQLPRQDALDTIDPWNNPETTV